MRHDASRRLHAHWDALRAGRPAPARDEIDPAAIRDVLACVFVLDVAALPLPRPADATFRLAGTRLDALFGRTLRGSGFDLLWAPRSSALAAAALAAVLDGRHPVTAAARGGPRPCDAVDIELLLLPLAPRAGLGARVLGALSAAATPGWMGLAPSAALDLLSVAAPHPDTGRPDTGRPDTGRPGFGRRVGRPLTLHPGGRRDGAPATARP